ncbi:hypothetical protein L1987_70535 [Smallanthus sonchifolius]|uniref:Uncharacterized protein n=1 Tax=Smallanthus sonchifolius TaxID=185202 RepID=A0ACB9AR68_9ASTR|nr:hypothetical protein L1987_70535 [Smallanthus sonchifolius]
MKNATKIGAQTALMKMTSEGGGFSWQSHNDVTESYDDNSFTTVGLLEQLNVTRDSSDYLWYMTDVRVGSNEGFLRSGKSPTLLVSSAGHALHVFINGQLSGTVYGSQENHKLTFNKLVNPRPGVNKISLLSIAVGLPVGLKGEILSLHSLTGSSSVEWTQGSFVAQRQPLTWYKYGQRSNMDKWSKHWTLLACIQGAWIL